jgi:prepilin-type N-terminal cleavage/methylation domain-containing protein
MYKSFQPRFSTAWARYCLFVCHALAKRFQTTIGLIKSVRYVACPLLVCSTQGIQPANTSYDGEKKGKRPLGFTLVELLVVITLVALLALGVMMSLDGMQDDARLKITQSEMAELRKALLQFKSDVGHFPGATDEVPPGEDEALLMLGLCHDDLSGVARYYDEGCTPFDIDSKRGWRGPYALLEPPADNTSNRGFFDGWGNAYRLYDLDSDARGAGIARIVSFGPDGRDGAGGNTNEASAACVPVADSDDLVLCLVQ